jgi:hypothetical protein
MWNITTIMGSTTYYARCTSEIKSRIAMVKAAFTKNKNLFNSKLDLNSWKQLLQCYSWSTALYGVESWATSRWEIPGKFRNVVLEKDGDHLDRSCDKRRSIA